MVNIQDIKCIIEDKRYMELSRYIQKTINIEIENDLPPLASLNIYAVQLNKAKLSPVDILEIANEHSFISNFIELNLKDDYANEDEDEDEIITLPFYKDFIISYLVMAYLIQYKLSELPSYFNKIGFKNGKKESQRILNLFKRARNMPSTTGN